MHGRLRLNTEERSLLAVFQLKITVIGLGPGGLGFESGALK